MEAHEQQYPMSDSKQSTDHLENGTHVLSDDIDNSHGDVVNSKALYRKIDLRIVPWLAFLYLLSFVSALHLSSYNGEYADEVMDT